MKSSFFHSATAIFFLCIACISSVDSIAQQAPPPGRGTPATPAIAASSATDAAKANGVQLELNAANSHAALMRLVDSFELYHPARNLKGSIVLDGSTTMMQLGKAWADRFRQFHKDVVLTRGVDGTNAGLSELAKDPTRIVGVSRPLTNAEIETLKKGKCVDPVSVIVALDPIALYVHDSNPLKGVTPEQFEAMLRAPGQNGAHVAKWSELGLGGEFEGKQIQFHCRSEISGTKSFIKNVILRGEELTKEAGSHESNGAVCDAIAKDPYGMGLAGFGSIKPGIRPVPLVLNGVTVPANEESFLMGQYPLVRPLVIVFDRAEMKKDGGLREEILRYILSREGQLEAIREGFFPLDPSFVHQELDMICGPRIR
ncbi:MAG: PstS family phosphate ABC transporter substrate-binding protein [Pirellula sp.]